jgi:hypothetical protein
LCELCVFSAMTTPSTSTPSAGSSTETNTNPSNLTAGNTRSPDTAYKVNETTMDSLRQLQKQVAMDNHRLLFETYKLLLSCLESLTEDECNFYRTIEKNTFIRTILHLVYNGSKRFFSPRQAKDKMKVINNVLEMFGESSYKDPATTKRNMNSTNWVKMLSDLLITKPPLPVDYQEADFFKFANKKAYTQVDESGNIIKKENKKRKAASSSNTPSKKRAKTDKRMGPQMSEDLNPMVVYVLERVEKKFPWEQFSKEDYQGFVGHLGKELLKLQHEQDQKSKRVSSDENENEDEDEEEPESEEETGHE